MRTSLCVCLAGGGKWPPNKDVNAVHKCLRVGCYKWVTLYCVWSCPPCWMLQVGYTILCVVLPSVLDVTSELHYIVDGPAFRVGCYKWVTQHCVWSCPPCWMLQVSYSILFMVLPSVFDGQVSYMHYIHIICPGIVWEPIWKRVHTQLVREHSATAGWATVDWSWRKERN